MALKQQAKLGVSVTAQSFEFFKNHKSLALMPVFSFLLVLIFIAVVAFGVFEVAVLTDFFGNGADAAQSTASSPDSSNPTSEKTKILSIAGSFALFCMAACMSIVITFFNVALAASVLAIFHGKDVGLLGGISIASHRMKAVLGWAFISTIIGAIADTIERRGWGFASLLTILAGLAWRMATFFVIPVIASEKVGPISAIKESVKIMRDVWGASVVSNLGLRWVKIVIVLIVAGGLWLTHLIFGVQGVLDSLTVVIPLGLIALLLLSCLSTISRTALFFYATENTVPPQFEDDVLKNAISPKTGGIR